MLLVSKQIRFLKLTNVHIHTCVCFELNSSVCLQVIPEVDMPGHGHAAIKAMESRRKRLLAANNQSEANRCGRN